MSWEWFRGDFESWDAAAAAAGSYADPAILERVVQATRKVRDGQAAYERDGFAFAEARQNGPLLAALFQSAAAAANALRVLDFGGALGSLYWQHRGALSSLRSLEWRVVEQAHYAAAGRREFQTDALSFWPDLAGAWDGWSADIVVLSGVVQNLPAPYAFLQQLVDLRPPRIFVDRMPLLAAPRDRLTIEHVPPDLGGGTYPAWFLSEERFLAAFTARYAVGHRFLTYLEGGSPERWDVFGTSVHNQGFLLVLREPPA